MKKNQEKKKGNEKLNIPAEWLDVVKWAMIFVIVIYLPLILFAIYWVFKQPPMAVFLPTIVVYLILAIIMLLPVVRKDNMDRAQKDNGGMS